MVSQSRIVGFGGYVPERVLTNAELETMVETSDEWIVQRTGIHERRIVAPGQYGSDMAIAAVQDLIDRHQVEVDDVDQIIVTSFTPDHFTPTISGLVQGHFGMHAAGTFDLSAGCTGYSYALSLADALVTSGVNKKVLVIAAEMVSKVTDYEDRSTCILFGDGAAACVVEKTDEEGAFLGRYFDTDGDMAHYVTCGNHSDVVNGVRLGNHNVFEQNGQQVYKYVMQKIPKGFAALLGEAQLTTSDISWFIPHSANARIIQALCSRLGIEEERTLTSVECFGNTSSASIPLALWLADKEGTLQKGDIAVLYGFGGGLTHGGVAVRL